MVGKVVLPPRFDLSQALCVCVLGGFPGLQEVSCCVVVIVV